MSPAVSALVPLWLLPSALAAAPPPTDLDGDGKPETIEIREEEVRIGGAKVPCGGIEMCSVAIHDVSSADASKEVALTELGPRDDAAVTLYRYDQGKLTELSFRKPTDGEWSSTPSAIATSGNGIVLADFAQRTYTRREKYVAQGAGLAYVPQPFWLVGYGLHVDRSLPITRTIGGSEVVANVRPDSDVTLVLESADHEGWFLVHISSGLTGWAQLEALMSASDSLMGLMSAG